jgi:hypothetical protein
MELISLQPGIEQGGQHHLRSIWRCSLLGITSIECGKIKRGKTLPNKPGRVCIGNPGVNGWREKKELSAV